MQFSRQLSCYLHFTNEEADQVQRSWRHSTDTRFGLPLDFRAFHQSVLRPAVCVSVCSLPCCIPQWTTPSIFKQSFPLASGTPCFSPTWLFLLSFLWGFDLPCLIFELLKFPQSPILGHYPSCNLTPWALSSTLMASVTIQSH